MTTTTVIGDDGGKLGFPPEVGWGLPPWLGVAPPSPLELPLEVIGPLPPPLLGEPFEAGLELIPELVTPGLFGCEPLFPFEGDAGLPPEVVWPAPVPSFGFEYGPLLLAATVVPAPLFNDDPVLPLLPPDKVGPALEPPLEFGPDAPFCPGGTLVPAFGGSVGELWVEPSFPLLDGELTPIPLGIWPSGCRVLCPY